MFSREPQARAGRILPRIAFDLDETLGVPVIDGVKIAGWQLRQGCSELLARLEPHFALCLWTVSSRRYVEKVLGYGLGQWFREVWTWDELPVQWKDIRRIGANFLVDDSPHHREAARCHELADSYIVVPSYGSPEDVADPTGWVRLVESAVYGTR
ncbi:MAG: hypothetical protein JNM56_08925 [Planctomycetia bacterium]|nr:hypothetical protein [Planctomycetia bacterium]